MNAEAIRQKAIECAKEMIFEYCCNPCKKCEYGEYFANAEVNCMTLYGYEHGFADGVEEGKKLASEKQTPKKPKRYMNDTKRSRKKVERMGELLNAPYHAEDMDTLELRQVLANMCNCAYGQGRADERKNVLDEVIEVIKTRVVDNLGLEDATKYGNKTAKQQNNSYCTLMKYEIADAVEDLFDALEQMKEGGEK